MTDPYKQAFLAARMNGADLLLAFAAGLKAETLERHMALAAEHGDAEYAKACRAELTRRETPELELEAA